MTTQMQNLMSRVDGVIPLIAPVSIVEPPAPSGAQTAPARKPSVQARRRIARDLKGARSGSVPRWLEVRALTEPDDMPAELLAEDVQLAAVGLL